MQTDVIVMNKVITTQRTMQNIQFLSSFRVPSYHFSRKTLKLKLDKISIVKKKRQSRQWLTVFSVNAALKTFAKFTGKHQSWNLFFIKVVTYSTAAYSFVEDKAPA